MSYTIDIVVPAVPDQDVAAWTFIDKLRERYYGDERARAPVLMTLHDQITASYPCLSSYGDADPGRDSCPWADAPLINNFCSEMGMLALTSGPNLETVVAFVAARAAQLGLTVFDPQQGRIHRPPKPQPFAVAINGILDGFAREHVITALARMVKREEAQIRALLGAPGTVVKQGLDRATAEKYRQALAQIGCACRILPAAAPTAPPEAPAVSRFDQLKEASGRGDAEAQYGLGMAYSLGDGVAPDDEEAARWLEKSADQGWLPAVCAIANCYYTGRGVFKSYAVALHWANMAAEHGNQSAQFLLWRMYLRGEGVPPDHVKADRWLAKAAEQGHPQAQFETGNSLYRLKNLPMAVTWLMKAAAQGNADAQAQLAVMHIHGDGVARDIVAAVQLSMKAAEQGNAHAQFNLGVMLESGESGVVPDDAQALNLFRQAAAQGHAGAESALGTRYSLGLGVERDLVKGFEWTLKAAEHGDASSQFSVAGMYLDGEGVRADKDKFHFWLEQAAALGHPDALRIVKSMDR